MLQYLAVVVFMIFSCVTSSAHAAGRVSTESPALRANSFYFEYQNVDVLPVADETLVLSVQELASLGKVFFKKQNLATVKKLDIPCVKQLVALLEDVLTRVTRVVDGKHIRKIMSISLPDEKDSVVVELLFDRSTSFSMSVRAKVYGKQKACKPEIRNFLESMFCDKTFWEEWGIFVSCGAVAAGIGLYEAYRSEAAFNYCWNRGVKPLELKPVDWTSVTDQIASAYSEYSEYSGHTVFKKVYNSKDDILRDTQSIQEADIVIATLSNEPGVWDMLEGKSGTCFWNQFSLLNTSPSGYKSRVSSLKAGAKFIYVVPLSLLDKYNVDESKYAKEIHEGRKEFQSQHCLQGDFGSLGNVFFQRSSVGDACRDGLVVVYDDIVGGAPSSQNVGPRGSKYPKNIDKFDIFKLSFKNFWHGICWSDDKPDTFVSCLTRQEDFDELDDVGVEVERAETPLERVVRQCLFTTPSDLVARNWAKRV